MGMVRTALTKEAAKASGGGWEYLPECSSLKKKLPKTWELYHICTEGRGVEGGETLWVWEWVGRKARRKRAGRVWLGGNLRHR